MKTNKVKKLRILKEVSQQWLATKSNLSISAIRKIEDNQQVSSELLEGINYLKNVSKKATASEKGYWKQLQDIFGNEKNYDEAIVEATSEKLQ